MTPIGPLQNGILGSGPPIDRRQLWDNDRRWPGASVRMLRPRYRQTPISLDKYKLPPIPSNRSGFIGIGIEPFDRG